MRRTVMLVVCAAAVLAIGATAFLTICLPRWFPEQCARYSPSAEQVVGVYLAYARWDVYDRRPGEIASERISGSFGIRAMPSLLRALTSTSTDATTKYLALGALGAIGPQANAAVPVILAGIRSRAIPVYDVEGDYLFKILASMGPSPAWTTALRDPDEVLARLAIDYLRRYGEVNGFLTLWRALNENAVAQRQYLINHLSDFDYAGFKQRGDRLPELIAALRQVEAHGSENLSDWASWILGEVEETE